VAVGLARHVGRAIDGNAGLLGEPEGIQRLGGIAHLDGEDVAQVLGLDPSGLFLPERQPVAAHDGHRIGAPDAG
jgi:hypothetical protein